MKVNPKVEKVGARRVMAGKAPDRIPSKSPQGPVPITPEPHPASKAPVLELGETGDRERSVILVATDGSEAKGRIR